MRSLLSFRVISSLVRSAASREHRAVLAPDELPDRCWLSVSSRLLSAPDGPLATPRRLLMLDDGLAAELTMLSRDMNFGNGTC